MEKHTRQQILEEILTRKQTITQRETAKILDLTPGRVSSLIRERKLEAIGKPPKPILESVLKYKTNPNMKRRQKKQDEI